MGFLSIVGYIVIIIGILGLLATSIWFLVLTFKEGILWGLGCLFLPLVSLVFLIKFWRDAWKPWVGQILSAVVIALGALVVGASAAPDMANLAEVSYSYEEYPDGDGEDYEDDYSAYADYDAADADTDSADGSLDATPGVDGEATTDDAMSVGDGEAAIEGALAPTSGLPEPSLGATGNAGRASQTAAAPPSRISASGGRGGDAGSFSIDFAEDYVGRRLKITKSSGKVIYCRLLAVEDDHLLIQQTLGGGTVKFSLPKSSISRLSTDSR